MTHSSHPLMLRVRALGVPVKPLCNLAGINSTTGSQTLQGAIPMSITVYDKLQSAIELLESGAVCLFRYRSSSHGRRSVEPLWRPEDATDPTSLLQQRILELERQLEEAQAVADSVLNLPQALENARRAQRASEIEAGNTTYWRNRALAAEEELARYGEAVL